MEMQDYSPILHQDLLRRWFNDHDMDQNVADGLPSIGFVISEGGIPLAAAFLRKMEGEYALLDGLIGHPKMIGKKRSQAIDLAVEKVIQKSKELKIKKLLAYSTDSAVLRRSLKHGFNYQPDTLIALHLE